MDERNRSSKLTSGQQTLLMENMGNIQLAGQRRRRSVFGWIFVSLCLAIAAGLGALLTAWLK